MKNPACIPKLSVIATALCLASQAFAVSFDFTVIHTSSGTPQGPAPYATLDVTQFGVNTVKLRLEATNLGASEFISFFKYNIEGSATSPAITATITNSFGLPTPPTFVFLSSPANDAGLQFDAEVNFETSNSGGGVNRFKDGEFLEWTLSRSGLTVANIDLPMMIHIQGLANDGSAKVIATPTPGVSVPDSGTSVALLGLALTGLAFSRRLLKAI